MFGGTFVTFAGKSATEKHRIRTFAQKGHLTKLAPGVYLDANTWVGLTMAEQHVMKIASHSLSAPQSLAVGSSAATLLGLPLEHFPFQYPLESGYFGSAGPRSHPRAATNHRFRQLSPHHKKHFGTTPVPTIASINSARYEDVLAPGASINYRDIRLTSPLITGLDLARWHSLDCAVMALDFGLRNKLFTQSELLDCATQLNRTRGSQQVRQAVRLATPWSESPMESRTKVGMWRRGFPVPLQQVSFFDAANSFVGRADFYFPSHALIVEYDGKGKYAGEFGIDREQAQLAEFFRQRNLHDGGVAIVRLTSDANSIDAGLNRIARRLSQTDATGHLVDLYFQASGPAWQE